MFTHISLFFSRWMLPRMCFVAMQNTRMMRFALFDCTLLHLLSAGNDAVGRDGWQRALRYHKKIVP